jgi:acyl-CoA synthetase (NDP forming)
LGATGAGVLVQPMLTGDGHDLELIVGAHRDLSFGPVVTVGLGGVLVDVLRDSVSLVPPFGDAEVRRALGRLRAAPLLGEFRGRPARDVDALVDLLVAFGAAALDLADDVEEMELNPVMLRAAGAGAVGLDALVRLRAEGAGRS